MFEFFEVHDFDGVCFYRWDVACGTMEFCEDGTWYPSSFTPAMLMYYAEEWDDVSIFKRNDGPC
jgi:hypothetical protein